MRLSRFTHTVYRAAAAPALAGTPALKGAHVVAAVSGGLDSVVLLDFLVWLRTTIPFDLTVAHMNHALREAAAADAAWVHAHASACGLDVVVQTCDVAAEAKRTGEGLEAAGRRLRYAFLDGLLATHDRGYVALGHHQDDQVETLLLHLTRGSSLTGLGGMRLCQGTRWRPWLMTPRTALERVAAERHLSWRDDATNTDCRFLRNRIRHTLVPVWREVAGFDVSTRLAATSRALQDDSDLLATLADEAYGRVTLDDARLSARALAALPDALAVRVLIRWLQARGHEAPNARQLRTLLTLVAREGRSHVVVSGGACVTVCDGVVSYASCAPDG